MTRNDADRTSLPRVLTINGGSSSIKFALLEPGAPPRRSLSGRVERIGLPDAFFAVAAEGVQSQSPLDAPNHGAAVGALLERLGASSALEAVVAVGHRVVHGGPKFTAPQRVTPELLEELRRLSPFDPDHLPSEIELIEVFARRLPRLPQVACFDTAFHHDLPRLAQILPLPRRYETAGVRRYGFHGLSYAYLMEELTRVAGSETARGRVVLAHLGNGASLCAVRAGRSVDTSMAFTPTAGLPMSTRSGDLDPGLVWYLHRTEGMTPEQFQDLVNRRCGLLGVSETSPDMRDLLARRDSDPRAAEAVALFCYQAKKWLGAFAAALGGLDTLVFSGGIGERAAPVRAEICQGMDFLGIQLDAARNAAHAPVVSTDESRVVVRVIPTDEEVIIAKAVWEVVEAR